MNPVYSFCNFLLLSIVAATPTPRLLAPGDFDDLTLIYQDAEITIDGPFSKSTGSGFTDVSVSFSNIVCRDIDISDITWEYSEPDSRTMRVVASVVDVSATCELVFEVDAIGINPSGSATGTVIDASSTYQIDFISPTTLDQNPPDSNTLSDCVSRIGSVDFEINEFSGNNLIRNAINLLGNELLDEQMSRLLCNLQQPVEDAAGRILEVNDFLEPYLGEQDRPTDPLAPEKNLIIEEGVLLVNFINPNTTFSIAVDEIIQRASDALNGEDIDEATNQTDLKVNILLREQLLDENGNFDLDVSSFSTGALFETTDNDFIEVVLSLQSVRVSNLDQFTQFGLLERIGNYSFSTSFAIPEISFDAEFELVLRPPDETTDEVSFVQTFTTAVTISNIDISLAFLLAIDENRIETLRLGSILDTGSLLECLLSFLYDAEIAVFSVGDMSIDRPTVFGFSSPGFERVVPAAVNTGYDMFRSILNEALPNLVENVVFDTLNEELDKYTAGERDCPEIDYDEMMDFIDFRDLLLPPAEAAALGGSGTQPYGDLAAIAKGFLDNLLDSEDGTGFARINELVIDGWTEDNSGMPGTLVYDGNLIRPIDGNVSSEQLEAELQLRIYNASISGLNTLTEPFELLVPMDGKRTQLNNSATIGSDDRPVRLALTLFFRLRTGDATEYIENELELALEVFGFTVIAPIVAEIIEGIFLSYPIDDVLDFNCILASVRTPAVDVRGVRLPGVEKSLGLTAFELLVDKVKFDVNCLSCTSEKFVEIGELLKKDPESKDVTDTVNSILDLVSDAIGGEFLQYWIDRELIEAPRRCSASSLYEPGANRTEYEDFPALEDDGRAQFLLLSVLLLCGCLMAVAYGIRAWISRIVSKRNEEWLKSLPTKRVLAIFKQQQKEDSREDTLNSLTKSVFRSECVPILVRYFIPLAMLGNAGLFLSGHISQAGAITVTGNLGGEKVELGDIFPFSIADSVIQLWEAEGYFLALVIALFSGVWPYVKLGITGYLWFAPTERVSISRRGNYFVTLDCLSKWSMVDVLLIVASLVMYQKTILSPKLSYLPDDLYSIKLYVQPKWGLYANLLAQIVAQITSTYIIHYHRRVVEVGTKEMNKGKKAGVSNGESVTERSDAKGSTGSPTASLGPSKPQRLCTYEYYRVDQGTDEVLRVKKGVTPGMLALSAVTVLFYIIGCSIKCFSLETLGFFGLIIESGRGFEQAIDEFSVFDVASFLMDQARFLDTSRDMMGHFLLATVLVVTVLIIPCLQLGLMCFQWLYPMGTVFRNRVLTAIEVLQAWQYSEVFLVALLVATLNVGTVSSSIVSQICGELDPTFAWIEHYGLIDKEDATCFGQEARVLGGFYVLLFAALFLSILQTFVITATLHWQRDMTTTAHVPIMDQEDMATLADEKGIGEMLEKIHPPPILFTDRFFFLLTSEDYMV